MTNAKSPRDLVDHLGPAQPLQEQFDEAEPKLRKASVRPPAARQAGDDDEALSPSERPRLPESSEEAFGQEGKD